MRLFKIIGSGPLSWIESYAHVVHMDVGSDDGVVLELDEQIAHGNRMIGRVTLSAETGMLITPLGQTDLVRIADTDKNGLRYIHANWHNLPIPAGCENETFG